MAFFEKAPLFTRFDVLAQPNLVPATRGVYAWFFRVIPPIVPSRGCYRRDGLTLLYVGISPKNAQSPRGIR